jgi:N-acetylglucosaminyldiphosphoundecaprenol N-acetyl-beta-D-mannosaminyltransferase
VDIPPKFNVLGVGVHALRFAQARELVLGQARERRGGYVCFCDANSISCARRDPAHRAALAGAFLVTPDGMPLVWLGRRAANKNMTAPVERVYGPDLMLALCEAGVGASAGVGADASVSVGTGADAGVGAGVGADAGADGSGLTHFFHGGGEGTAELLAKKLSARFPGLRVAGVKTPPFRELDMAEMAVLAARINMLKPHFLWVGLGTPKQEKFMTQFAPRIATSGTVMLGVGAAFDFLSGRVKQAPRWMRRGGLEWFYRLCAEPRRLAPRYFKNNPLFAARVLAQVTGLKKYPME